MKTFTPNRMKQWNTRQDKRGITIGESLQTCRDVTIINASDRDYTRNRYVLWFGAYGWTRLMVYANHLQDALDEAIDWIVEHAPGLLCDDSVTEAYNEAIAEGKTEDEAIESAEQDTTSGGNCGNRILSYEWGLALENPTREDLYNFISGN